MKKLNVAVIGFGGAAKGLHIPVILKNQNYILKQVMTRSLENQKLLKELYPDVLLITSLDQALNDKDIDLIVIATSNDVHYEYTKQTLEHNKHVICEKPFVETYEEALELFNLAESKNLLLKVFHNRKYDGEVLTAKKLLEENVFGKLISFENRFDRFRLKKTNNWREQDLKMSGIFYDLAPHLVHNALNLFGVPLSVYNFLSYQRDSSSLVDDGFEMILTYPNNFKVYLGASMIERTNRPKLKIGGLNKTYLKDGFDNPDIVNEDVGLYQENINKSVLIDNDLNESNIKLLSGKHYMFYEDFYTDLYSIKLPEKDKDLSLNVVLIMEKALESNLKETNIKL